MGRGYFVTGTDTGVGKTVVTAALAGVLRKNGIGAVAIKPVQSGGVRKDGELCSEDALFYRAAAGLPHPVQILNPCCLEPPVAPGVAAGIAGVDIDPAELAATCRRLAAAHEVALVEGAGGLAVPLTPGYFTVAQMAVLLGFPLLVVARPGLGTINHTLLTVAYARGMGLVVKGIIISGYDEETATAAERTNPRVIEAMSGVPLLGILPRLDGVSVESCLAGGLVDAAEKHLRWREL